MHTFSTINFVIGNIFRSYIFHYDIKEAMVEKQVIYLEFLDSSTHMLKKKKIHIYITYKKRIIIQLSIFLKLWYFIETSRNLHTMMMDWMREILYCARPWLKLIKCGGFFKCQWLMNSFHVCVVCEHAGQLLQKLKTEKGAINETEYYHKISRFCYTTAFIA